MEVELCNDIRRLPEECVSHVISLTTPRDACRSEAVSAAFRSAAVSDDVWKRFLPSDYAEILARAVERVEFASMKHLYFRLYDPILIDGGKMGFYVDRETGVKCFILSARELGIAWGDNPKYWRWIDSTEHPESNKGIGTRRLASCAMTEASLQKISNATALLQFWQCRFSQVAALMCVCWLEIHGRINSRMLSKWTNYSAYLIFKVVKSARGFRYPLQEVSVTVGAHVSKLSVRLMEEQNYSRLRCRQNIARRADLPEGPQEVLREPLNDQPVELQEDVPEDQRQREHEIIGKPQIRQDGWMEILLGE